MPRVITCYLRVRILTSTSIWTKPSILHILHYIWSPLTKWGYMGPIEAVLCNVCKSFSPIEIPSQFRLNSSKWNGLSFAVSNVAINGHTSLQQDILYHCWTYLASLHLLGILMAMLSNMKAAKLVKTGNAGTNMARIYHITPLEQIMDHYMPL